MPTQETETFNASVAAAVREGGQAVTLITSLQGQVVTANEATAAAIASNATDKEIADAARAAQPQIDAVVTALDAFTPEATPVTPTMRSKKKR